MSKSDKERDAVLSNMLNTPPNPKKIGQEKAPENKGLKKKD